VLSIESDFSLKIDQDPALLKNLDTKLFKIFSARAEERIFLHATTDLPFGTLARIIDIARGAGAGDIGLMVTS